MRALKRFCIATTVVGVLAAAPLTGHAATPEDLEGAHTLDWPVGEFVSYALDSGALDNPQRGASVVFADVVTVTDAAWMRLYFDQVELAPGSTIRMTASYDGEVQELDAAGAAMWHYTSAYFNGDTVLLELIAAPGSRGNRVVLDRVAVHIIAGGLRGPCADDDCGICGSDNRTQSDVYWSGRLMPVGCTGSVYNTDSCVVSAGHCAEGGWDDVIQFNVPNSSSNCYPYNPPTNDQFPITAHLYQSNGVGADWAVMTTGTNGQGEKPYDRYGVYTPIATSTGGPGQGVSVWGYGVDNGQPTWSQTQQTSNGTIGSLYGSYYTYDVDVTYGNSGSGLIRDGSIIGIVTHCSFSCANIATRADLSAFEDAREQLCGGGSGYCAASSSSTSYEHISNVTVGSIDNSSGSDGYANYTGQSTDMQVGTGYPITVSIGTAYASDIGGLWIDWNQDQDFSDSGETITTSWSGSGPYSTTITPPAGATLGDTRLRVRIQDSNYDSTLSSCGTTSYGEVEDYTVTVVEQAEYDPPEPNPMTFDQPPTAISAFATEMTATTATDATPPVEYEFDFVSGGSGGSGSSWQTSTEHWDGFLQSNTEYTYRVRARDSSTPANVTGWSSTVTVATLALTPPAPALSNATDSTLDLDVMTANNPDYTEMAVRCTATAPYDPAWNGKYVNASGDPVSSAVWQTDDEWGMTTLQGLESSTDYTLATKARNLDDIETDFGAGATLATTGSSYPPGDMNCDGVVDFGDINPFVQALSDPAGYAAAYPDCDIMNGDVSGDGEVDFGDINPFVALLTG